MGNFSIKLSSLLLPLLLIGSSACDNSNRNVEGKTTGQRVGEVIDETTSTSKEAAKAATTEVKARLNEAAEAMNEAGTKAKEALEEAARTTLEEVSEADKKIEDTIDNEARTN
jgi:ElaB/YqjD/DUF883 family membrane-anchored ribosome-binding protein